MWSVVKLVGWLLVGYAVLGVPAGLARGGLVAVPWSLLAGVLIALPGVGLIWLGRRQTY